MRERYSDWLAGIVIVLVVGTVIYMAVAETERFAWGWHLMSEEWHGVAVQFVIAGFCFWRAVRALGIGAKPCSACGGSGKGDWPTEDADGNVIHVCGQCRSITGTKHQGNVVRGVVLGLLAGFCLMYGLIQFGHLWQRPTLQKPAVATPTSSIEK